MNKKNIAHKIMTTCVDASCYTILVKHTQKFLPELFYMYSGMLVPAKSGVDLCRSNE